MSKFKKPEFLLQKILADGSAEEPRIHQIHELEAGVKSLNLTKDIKLQIGRIKICQV